MARALRRRLKIATMVRGMLPVPRPHDAMYSPLDVAITVAEKLTANGHRVTYFGAKGTQLNVTNVQTSSLHPFIFNNHDFQTLLENPDLFMSYIPSLYDQILVQDMFKRAARGEFDLLHFHHFESAMAYASLFPQVPVAYTLHDAIDPWRRELIEAYLSHNQHFISISNNQRLSAPDLPYAATVYNGVDTSLFIPNGGAEDYLLFVGRIVPEKGVKEAVQIAKQSNARLLIIGQVPAPAQWYFDTHVKPYLDDKILHLGYMDKAQLVRYYQKARALLMPIQWEEPFGLTMAEAMACGTPVIAMRRGSVPEIIVDGKTGFIANSIGEMIEALDKLGTIKRTDCRTHATTYFSTHHMISGYEETFHNIVAASKLGNLQRGLTGAVHKVTKPIKSIRTGVKKATADLQSGHKDTTNSSKTPNRTRIRRNS